jgi:hypothetical protein
LTGAVPEPYDTLVLFFTPDESGEPESVKNTAAATTRMMPINPGTSRDHRITRLGPGSECTGFATGDKRCAAGGCALSEMADRGLTGTSPFTSVSMKSQNIFPLSIGLPLSWQNGIFSFPDRNVV